MFDLLYELGLNFVLYLLPRQKGTISSWEKKEIERFTANEYRLATPELDGKILGQLANLAQKSRLNEPPKLIIYKSDFINGGSLSNKTLLVSTGAISKLHPRELETVLAHEMTHNKQRSILAFTDLFCAASIIVSGVFAAKKADKWLPQSIKDQPNVDILAKVTAFLIGTQIVTMLVKIPRQIIRRMCEYDADHGSLLLTNDPEAIKSNFLKMKEEREAYRLTKKPIPSTDSLANTDTKLLIPAPNPTLSSPLSPIKTLLQSHPSFDKRIAYIEKLQKQMEDKSSEKTI